MLVLDEPGRQQQDRRRQMIDLFQLGADVTTRMIDNLPFRPGGRRASRALITPFDELYDEGKQTLLDLLHSRGIRTVMTGIGGDEMVALTTDELPRPPLGHAEPAATWAGPSIVGPRDDFDIGMAPASAVNEVTLLAMACVAPPILRAGMWPVHPLADPAVIRIGESLPYEWRYRKRLHTARLERLGCSPYLTDPPLRENFEQVMAYGLRQHGVRFLREMLTEGSVLFDGGYIDPHELAATVARLSDGTATAADRAVCHVIVVESTLRSYGHAISPTAVPA
jgi:hypothetical protein